MSNNTSPVWIVDPANVGITNPSYPSMKHDTQLTTRYYGTDVVSQGQVTLSLTTAQILGMFATPVTLLPSPGAGYALVVNGFIFSLIAGATAFQAGGNVALFYASGDGKTTQASASVPVADVQNAASGVTNVTGITTRMASALMSNVGLNIWNATQAFTTGNGSAKVTVLYSVITL